MKPGGLLPLVVQPDVSVVMPVFNGSRYLKRALASVSEQHHAGWELLAVDDCSRDDSYDQLLEWADADLRIRVFRSAGNRGPSAARNLALLYAAAPLVAYLDCDDEYYLDYLSQVHAWGGRSDVCFFPYDKIQELPDRLLSETWDPAPVRGQLLQHNIVCPLGVAHRKDLLLRSGLFDEKIWYEEDWDLWKRFARADATFICSQHKSGRYHVRDDSLSRTRRCPEAMEQ